jgi:hypothetical protein
MGDVLPLDIRASERRRKQLADVARDKTRPYIARWLKEVDAKISDRKLPRAVARFARAITNFPSMNYGICWQSQSEFAKKLGYKSERTIRYFVAGMTAEGLLCRKQRGFNRSNIYTLQIGGEPLIPGSPSERVTRDSPSRKSPSRQDRQGIAGQDRQEIAGQDRQEISSYPFESDPLENIDSLPTQPPPSKLPREASKAYRHSLTVSEIIERVVLRLGRGSEDAGWVVYQSLPHDLRNDLRARERAGTINDQIITSVLEQEASKRSANEGGKEP